MPIRRSGIHARPSPLSQRTNEIVGLSLVGFAVFLAISLWTFDSGDPTWGSYVNQKWKIRNYGGTVGAYAAGAMVQAVGAFSVLMPIGFFVWGVTAFAGLRSWRPGWRELAGLFFLLSASGLFFKAYETDPLFGETTLAGGIVGYSVVILLNAYLGSVGSWVLLGSVFLASFVGMTGFSFKRMIVGLAIAHWWFFSRIYMVFKNLVLGTTRAAVFAARKVISTIVGFPSAMRKKESFAEYAETITGGEDAGPEYFEQEELAGDKPPLNLSNDYVGELILEPEKSCPSNQKNGKRASRLSAQNGPSLFGGGKFPEPELPALRGPAAYEEESEPPEKPMNRFDEGMAGSVFESLLQNDDDDLFPADVGVCNGLPPNVSDKQTPKAGEEIDKQAKNVIAKRKSVPGGLRIKLKKNLDVDRDESSSPLDKAATLRGSPDTIPDSPSTHVDDATKNGESEEHITVRYAGTAGESGAVQFQDLSLVRSNEQTENQQKEQRTSEPTEPKKEYVLPSIDIFADPPSGGLIVDEAGIREKSLLLEQTLKEFGVVGTVKEVKTGPVITSFEYDPAPGIKVSKITGLADDLARALSALSVRIVAPIPGKSVVGIEVPNIKRDAVFAKEVLSSREFKQAEDKLTMGLGKDILGRTAFTDLAKIPHLLIAGTTGAGKSVALNMMICSLLTRCTPREVRFLMIDPKMLELSIYEGIPHQLVPVVTDPKKASAGLRGVLAEMERRYKIMSEAGVRNIQGYNASVARQLGEREANRRWKQPLANEDSSLDFLPYIVVVIDELADLMMVAPREVEESMTRLAQMARASGIHLLVATQRPSVDVLTGLIKANFPSRIALRVATRTDSRTILDSNGAERLLGKGDMLFVPPGSSTPVRIHGAYVSDSEISHLVAHWKSQGEAIFREDWFVEEENSSQDSSSDEEYDERYDDAIALVSKTREASISLIQRHLRIGYNRAARMIERMEQDGIIGPADGVKRRQVLISEIPGEEPVETP
ncbi:MAG: DNA translocase FtsK 4TM domain-containing protein [Nitrospinae bacterium]|nr:DNA translocase FtsK 4TM domain-containing protein [Nitrospinota bacterium]